ncbi:MAG TPA: hypothetical protein VFI25_02705 [Planctomycetota bacterium]|jgi:tetratricopeptide (TPR) repeat protein|nr:hypothetical protein [Planctomycetota bacterium]
MRSLAATTLSIGIWASPLLAQNEHADAGDALVRGAEEIRRGKDPDPEKVLDLLDQASREYREARGSGPVAVRSPVNECYRWAAGYYAAREDWERALKAWERWRPVTWCGNEGEAMRQERAGNIATCQTRLGRHDAALATLEAVLLKNSGLAGSADREALLYLEIAAQAGRLADAREKLRSSSGALAFSPVAESAGSRPSEEEWHSYRTAIALVEAYAAGDPAGILRALEHEWDPVRMYDFENKFPLPPQEYIFAGRYLANLGPSAIALVAKAIEEGNPRAFKVAGFTGREELAAILEKRLAVENDAPRQGLIDDALGRLRAKAVSPPSPTSRPSSEGR